MSDKSKTFAEWMNSRPSTSPVTASAKSENIKKQGLISDSKKGNYKKQERIPAPPCFSLSDELGNRHAAVPKEEVPSVKMKSRIHPPHSHPHPPHSHSQSGGSGVNNSYSIGRNESTSSYLKNSESSNSLSGSKWKSSVIYHEVALKELLSDDLRFPNTERLEKTLQHYQEVAMLFPLFRNVFELMLSEFRISMFASTVSTSGVVERVPYFETLASLKKENDELQNELADAKREVSQDTLNYELQATRSRNKYLTHQVDRLNQETETLLEDVSQLNRENEAISRNGRQAFSDLEIQNRKAQVEIRRLEKENTLMTHEVRSRKSNISEYSHLKLNQMSNVISMFHPSFEYSTYLQFRFQLEAAENQLLDDHDTDMRHLASQEHLPSQVKLVNKLKIILQEVKDLDDHCRLLLKGEELAIPGRGRLHSDISVDDKNEMLLVAGDSESREQFVENMLKKEPSCTQEVLLDIISELANRIPTSEPGKALKEKLVVPLLEEDVKRFDSKIEIHVGSGSSLEHLKTVSYVDGTAFELPPKSTLVALKHSKPFLPLPDPSSLNAAQHEELVDEMNRCPENCETFYADILKKALPRMFFSDNNFFKEWPSFDSRDSSAQETWSTYFTRIGDWCPSLPRALPDFVLEDFIGKCYEVQGQLLYSRFLEAKGNSKDWVEGFCDSVKKHDVVDSLVQVLEKTYQLPQVVAKVLFEIIINSEKNCQKSGREFVRLFLEVLPGTADVSLPRLLSVVIRLLTSLWPVSDLQMDNPVSQKELSSVLEVMYPTYSSSRLDEVMSDVAIFTKAVFTLSSVRKYFIVAITGRQEHHIRNAQEAIEFKTSALKWRELDRYDFADACSSLDFNHDSDYAVMKDRFQYRHLESCVRLGARSRLPVAELSLIAAETIWISLAELQGIWGKLKKETTFTF